MSAAETVTTALSILALVVSLVTLYLTYFHELIGCLAEIYVPEPGDPVDATFDFALSNTGNKDLLIRTATVSIPAQPYAVVPELRCKDIPLVIKPDHVALLTLDIPEHFLRNAAKAGNAISVEFELFGPRAASYKTIKHLKPVNDAVDFARDVWEPFSLKLQ